MVCRRVQPKYAAPANQRASVAAALPQLAAKPRPSTSQELFSEIALL